MTVETALNVELDEHLGYEKHSPKPSSNSRNGYSTKSIITDDGEVPIDVPRDRESSFEPKLVRKHQTRFQSMDDKILSLYAKHDDPRNRSHIQGNVRCGCFTNPYIQGDGLCSRAGC